MEKQMFCFQCEQTAGCSGCTGKAGVCGKTADTAGLQDELTGALIGLARACANNEKKETTDRIIIEGLFTTVTNVAFDDNSIRKMINTIYTEKNKIVPDCAACASRCGNTDDYDMNRIWEADEDIRSLKSLILFGIRGMAAYAYHAMVLGYTDQKVNNFFYKALAVLAEDWGMEELLPVVMEVGEVNLTCMALLDQANTETFGTPTPTTVPLKVEKGPFIVVTGHDLYDLKLLLQQTEGKGINIYTHGEMLPAHAYPELKKFSHLKGNFGTAWQNQQKEFDNIPAPILYTTNCLMPPKASYADRVFTTEMVSFPETVHIDDEKDFTPVIEKALALGVLGTRIDPFVAAVTACSMNSGAYIAEIFRGGIQSISQGQMRAGLSLGMTYGQTMRYIILPQAFKRIIPPLGNEFIAMLKDSSLVSVIGFEELTRSGQLVIAETYATIEIWTCVALIYLILTLSISQLVRLLERRYRLSDER